MILFALAAVFRLWTAGGAEVGSSDPIAVGSLSKPFVAQAWAETYPQGDAPVVTCDRRSGCWRSSGHGTLDLRQAAAVSCNTYFRALANLVPAQRLAAVLRANGFVVPAALSADGAIGLPAVAEPLRIAPAQLLAAYVKLTREPWPAGERHRTVLLAGLRDGALDGTSAAMHTRGLWAKTGTVKSAAGPAWRTAGLALAVDDAGWAALGMLDPGTGRDAAGRMATVVADRHPSTSRGPIAYRPASTQPAAAIPVERAEVRVRLFELLQPAAVTATNLGSAPIGTNRGFVGAGGTLTLRTGDRLETGNWELRIASPRTRRRIVGSVAIGGGRTLTLVAGMSRREYANGVLLAELGPARTDHRVELAAAVLRFTAAGKRHADADVCDSTHCAWFVGRGPYLSWSEPRSPVADAGGAGARILTDAEWSAAQAQAHASGPAHWTSDCGSQPLSPHAVWGGTDDGEPVVAHAQHPAREWERRWSDREVERAFGAGVAGLAIAWRGGTWCLDVRKPDGAAACLAYDEAHERIARVRDWGALPSPADRITRTAGGYVVTGRGLGHRVGLCLRTAAPAAGAGR